MTTDQTPAAAVANTDLAARARTLADQAPTGSLTRKAALCAAVCLEETKTTTAGRKLLAQIRPPAVRAAATDLYDRLTGADDGL